jgi:Flp pilus assembly protein TadG
VAPTIILLAAGMVDFGMFVTNWIALTAATRIGAEYARARPSDAAGIQVSMQNSMSLMPALTFPETFAQCCECDDGTSITCAESCATAGRPGPNRVFIMITASQAFTPLVPWPGISRTLTATAKMRLR